MGLTSSSVPRWLRLSLPWCFERYLKWGSSPRYHISYWLRGAHIKVWLVKECSKSFLQQQGKVAYKGICAYEQRSLLHWKLRSQMRHRERPKERVKKINQNTISEWKTIKMESWSMVAVRLGCVIGSGVWKVKKHFNQVKKQIDPRGIQLQLIWGRGVLRKRHFNRSRCYNMTERDVELHTTSVAKLKLVLETQFVFMSVVVILCVCACVCETDNKWKCALSVTAL